MREFMHLDNVEEALPTRDALWNFDLLLKDTGYAGLVNEDLDHLMEKYLNLS